MESIRSLLCVFALSFVTIVGCGEAPEEGAAQIAIPPLDSSWTLDGIGDWRLPLSISVDEGISRQIIAGSLTMRSDRTWTLRYDYRELGAAIDRSGTHIADGSYQPHEDSTALFDLRDNLTAAVSVATVYDDGRIELSLGGHRFRFVTPH